MPMAAHHTAGTGTVTWYCITNSMSLPLQHYMTYHCTIPSRHQIPSLSGHLTRPSRQLTNLHYPVCSAKMLDVATSRTTSQSCQQQNQWGCFWQFIGCGLWEDLQRHDTTILMAGPMSETSLGTKMESCESGIEKCYWFSWRFAGFDFGCSPILHKEIGMKTSRKEIPLPLPITNCGALGHQKSHFVLPKSSCEEKPYEEVT